MLFYSCESKTKSKRNYELEYKAQAKLIKVPLTKGMSKVNVDENGRTIRIKTQMKDEIK